MTTSRSQPRHLATSPFRPKVEPIIETFEAGDLVSHDSYGMGRVVNVEAAAVTVDFRPRLVRIPSPYANLGKI